MGVQLALVGYVLTFLFGSGSSLVVLITLGVMVLTASWIALHPVAAARPSLYSKALLTIGPGGFFTLVVITQGVLTEEPWHNATILIPLGGMIFGASMNAVRRSAERFQAEQLRGALHHDARRDAGRAHSPGQYVVCGRACLTPRHDDRPDLVWSSTTHRGAVPNNGDVYVVRFSRNIDSILPPFPKTAYPGHTT